MDVNGGDFFTGIIDVDAILENCTATIVIHI